MISPAKANVVDGFECVSALVGNDNDEKVKRVLIRIVFLIDLI